LGEEGKINSEIDFQNTMILEIQIKEILRSKRIWRNSKNPPDFCWYFRNENNWT
jgi:hypothetical protein